MKELDINKSGFDVCYDALKALSSRLRDASGFNLSPSKDTSLMADRERQCFDELLNIINDLADLADETAKDVKLTKARYMLADK